MAEIWLAVQRGLHGFEKTAVLKVILPELCNNDEFVQMFLDEARLAAGIDHNNVVRIYDFGAEHGQYYIAMEHLPGEDLASVMQSSKRANSLLPIAFACDVIVGAATGLHYAHELTDPSGRLLNVVHRDVSPSNVIVTYHGTVKLVDFGIARAESNITKTAAGTLKGKVAYVSPEQAAGDPLDRRSDVFALGTVLYELLTLTRPFKRESDLATLKAVVEAPITPPSQLRPDLPAALDAIISKAMARPLRDRYQSAAELADELAAFLVSQQYVRSERAISSVMTGLFDAERRLGKLRVAQSVLEPSAKTPSAIKHLPQHLSPIRGTPSQPSLKVPLPAEEPPTKPENTTSVPIVEATAVEPTFARLQRRRNLLVGAGLGGAALIIGLGLLVAFGSSDATPVTVTPVPVVAEKPTPPVVPAVKEPLPEPSPKEPSEPAPKEPIAKEPPKPDPTPAPKLVKGKLTLDTTPWSEVFLKGKKLGDTPLVDFPLPPGLHVLTLVNEQKNLRTSIEVEISAGKTTMKKLKL